MHGNPTARTEDFRQYGFIHTDMGRQGQGSHVHERSWARTDRGAGSHGAKRVAGANVAREMEKAKSLYSGDSIFHLPRKSRS